MMNLLNKLHHRLIHLDPELHTRLREENRLTDYLDSYSLLPGDPEEMLCQTLWPSRYDYLAALLEEEFEECYLDFSNSGILNYELINLVAACAPVFAEYGFPENEDSRMLRYRIIGTVAEYLEGGTDDGL
jgi:hypothetical protein